mgnify:CR=1 FL=1
MKKNLMLMAVAGTLVALLITGGVMAWFTDTATITNSFTAGTVDVVLKEMGPNDEEWNFEGFRWINWNPGDITKKEVVVESKGSKKTYVRIKATIAWTSNTPMISPLPTNNVTLDYNANDWLFYDPTPLNPTSGDEYYYYKDILEVNEVTTPFFNTVTLSGPLTTNMYQGKTLSVNVTTEAIQASNGAMLAQWSVNPALIVGLEQF